MLLALWDHLWDHAPVAVNFPVTAGDMVGLRGARPVAGSAKGTPMAQWVRRPRTDGGESIQIKWRIGSQWQSETFTDPRLAAEFRTAVELAGHRWPTGWVRGEGWAAPVPGTADTPVPDVEPVPVPVVTVADVATGPEGYFVHQRKRMLRGKVKPYTVHRAERSSPCTWSRHSAAATSSHLTRTSSATGWTNSWSSAPHRSPSATGTVCCPASSSTASSGCGCARTTPAS